MKLNRILTLIGRSFVMLIFFPVIMAIDALEVLGECYECIITDTDWT